MFNGQMAGRHHCAACSLQLESRESVAWVSMAAGAENKPLPAELLLWRESGRAGEWGGLGSGECWEVGG